MTERQNWPKYAFVNYIRIDSKIHLYPFDEDFLFGIDEVSQLHIVNFSITAMKFGNLKLF